MKIKVFRKLSHDYFVTIDPGARLKGGTGVALFKKGLLVPKFRACIEGLNTNWQENCNAIISSLKNILTHWELALGTDVWIERPVYFDSLKGQTAAKSDSLSKLSIMYGRIFQLAFSLGHNPMELAIIKWKGQLTKQQVKTRVEQQTGLTFTKMDDTIDAIGMGIYLNKEHYASPIQKRK